MKTEFNYDDDSIAIELRKKLEKVCTPEEYAEILLLIEQLFIKTLMTVTAKKEKIKAEKEKISDNGMYI